MFTSCCLELKYNLSYRPSSNPDASSLRQDEFRERFRNKPEGVCFSGLHIEQLEKGGDKGIRRDWLSRRWGWRQEAGDSINHLEFHLYSSARQRA